MVAVVVFGQLTGVARRPAPIDSTLFDDNFSSY
jgi:hypothetical protein